MKSQREDLAVRLVEERTRLGFSQADFASKIGISREGLRLYEVGQRGISAEFLAEAANMGLDVQYVLSGVRSSNLKEVAAPKVAIEGSSNVIGLVEAGATVHQIHTQRHVTRTVAEVKPGDEHITEEQAAALTALVGQVVTLEASLRRAPKTHRAVWAALNAHCGVTRYRLIKVQDFEKARGYLHQWIGRLNSMSAAPAVDPDGWRKGRYAYIKINSRDDGAALAAYLQRNFQASSLTELSDDDLEKTYRFVVGRRSRSRGK